MSQTTLSTHNVFEPYQSKAKEHRGTCVAWTIEDGKARQCGQVCKGQYCKEHQHMTLPVGNLLSNAHGRHRI